MSPLPRLTHYSAGRDPTAYEAVEKRTISRKDAKVQRLAKNNSFVFFAPSTTLCLCVKCFCPSRDYFTASDAVGHIIALLTRLRTRPKPLTQRIGGRSPRLLIRPLAGHEKPVLRFYPAAPRAEPRPSLFLARGRCLTQPRGLRLPSACSRIPFSACR